MLWKKASVIPYIAKTINKKIKLYSLRLYIQNKAAKRRTTKIIKAKEPDS